MDAADSRKLVLLEEAMAEAEQRITEVRGQLEFLRKWKIDVASAEDTLKRLLASQDDRRARRDELLAKDSN